MRIVFIEQFYYPEGWGGAQLPRDVTTDLARAGCDVEVICGSDQYAAAEPGAAVDDPRTSGVRIRRVPRLIGGDIHRLKLLRQLWFYACALPMLIFRRRPDLDRHADESSAGGADRGAGLAAAPAALHDHRAGHLSRGHAGARDDRRAVLVRGPVDACLRLGVPQRPCDRVARSCNDGAPAREGRFVRPHHRDLQLGHGRRDGRARRGESASQRVGARRLLRVALLGKPRRRPRRRDADSRDADAQATVCRASGSYSSARAAASPRRRTWSASSGWRMSCSSVRSCRSSCCRTAWDSRTRPSSRCCRDSRVSWCRASCSATWRARCRLCTSGRTATWRGWSSCRRAAGAFQQEPSMSLRTRSSSGPGAGPTCAPVVRRRLRTTTRTCRRPWDLPPIAMPWPGPRGVSFQVSAA